MRYGVRGDRETVTSVTNKLEDVPTTKVGSSRTEVSDEIAGHRRSLRVGVALWP